LVGIKLAIDRKLEHRAEHRERARRRAAATVYDGPAALSRLDIRLALACRNVRLELGDVMLHQRPRGLPAKQWSDMPIDIAAIGLPARRFLIRLSGRTVLEIQIGQLCNAHSLAALVAPRSRIAAICNLGQQSPCSIASLVRRQHAMAANHATAGLRTASAGSVLQNVDLGPAWEHAEAETSQLIVPYEAVAGWVGQRAIDDPLCNLWHF
jgi:hypothetical protein